MKPYSRFTTLLLLALSVLLLPTKAWADLRVVTSLPTLAALVSEVGGTHVTVTALAQPDEDPHFVDSRPSFVLALSRADLLVENGLELEAGWLSVAQQQARNPAILAGGRGHFDASAHVRLLEVPTGTLDRSMGDVHAGGNPHFLVDPRAAAAIVIALGNRMAELDAGNAATYRANATRYSEELLAMAERYSAQFALLGADRRNIVEYHASFSYLNQWLGLTRIASIEPRPGVPPDPGHITSVRTQMSDRGVRAILQETFYPASTARTLASATGAQVVLVSGGVNHAAGQTYTQWIDSIVSELHHALAGN